MSRKSKLFVRRVSDLVDSSERLRRVLQGYEKANTDLARRIDKGEGAIEAMGKVRTSIRRRQITDTLDEFEAARHEVRLALMALCMEEGASRSEVGRMLGISRQLASRLAIEVEDARS
jgi:hypothetical protein